MDEPDLQTLKFMEEVHGLLVGLHSRADLNLLSPEAYARVHELVFTWATAPDFGADKAKEMARFFPAFKPMVWLCTLPEMLVPPTTGGVQ